MVFFSLLSYTTIFDAIANQTEGLSELCSLLRTTVLVPGNLRGTVVTMFSQLGVIS